MEPWFYAGVIGWLGAKLIVGQAAKPLARGSRQKAMRVIVCKRNTWKGIPVQLATGAQPERAVCA